MPATEPRRLSHQIGARGGRKAIPTSAKTKLLVSGWNRLTGITRSVSSAWLTITYTNPVFNTCRTGSGLASIWINQFQVACILRHNDADRTGALAACTIASLQRSACRSKDFCGQIIPATIYSVNDGATRPWALYRQVGGKRGKPSLALPF